MTQPRRGYLGWMHRRRDALVPLVLVAAAVAYLTLVPQDWYAQHVPWWIRWPLGVVLGLVWIALFVALPVYAKWLRTDAHRGND